jgi:uncharacterized membrane protein
MIQATVIPNLTRRTTRRAPDMNPSTADSRRSSKAELVRWSCFSAFLICAGLWLISWWRDPSFRGHWLESLLVVLAVASTIAGLSRALPVENAVMSAALVAIICGVIQIVGARTGIPFGLLAYTERAGPKLFENLPSPLPLFCVVVILNSREVARLILRPWRGLPNRGLWTLGLACLLAVGIDISLEPFAVKVSHFWIWRVSAGVPAWHTAPWVNFAGWLTTTFLALAFTTPWLINKQPVKIPAPNSYPLWVWLAVNLLLVVANASRGLRNAAVLGLVLTLVVAALGLRGLRWRTST